MGGNALKHLGAERLPAAEALRIGALIVERLRERLPEGHAHRAALIPAYRSKPDYGDIDLLVSSALFQYHRVEEIAADLGRLSPPHDPLPFVRNGPVLSLGVPLPAGSVFQVDLIAVAEESFEFALGYFAYNDLGNLIGRVAHRMGLKFGHDGLWLPIREGDRLYRTLLVTQHFPSALAVLGFGHQRWLAGFETLEDIYRYVGESERFARHLYPLEHRSHRARVRDAKRSTYSGFLHWLEAHPEIPDRMSYPARASCAQDWALQSVFDAFPDMALAYLCAQGELERDKRLRRRFNGELVQWITGLMGRDLGAVMARIRSAYPSQPDFREAVLAMSDAELEAMILRHAGGPSSRGN